MPCSRSCKLCCTLGRRTCHDGLPGNICTTGKIPDLDQQRLSQRWRNHPTVKRYLSHFYRKVVKPMGHGLFFFLIPLFVYLFLLILFHVWDPLFFYFIFFFVKTGLLFFFFNSPSRTSSILHSIEKVAAGLKMAPVIVIHACENECNMLLGWLYICKWSFHFQECIKIPDDFFFFKLTMPTNESVSVAGSTP